MKLSASKTLECRIFSNHIMVIKTSVTVYESIRTIVAYNVPIYTFCWFAKTYLRVENVKIVYTTNYLNEIRRRRDDGLILHGIS